MEAEVRRGKLQVLQGQEEGTDPRGLGNRKGSGPGCAHSHHRSQLCPWAVALEEVSPEAGCPFPSLPGSSRGPGPRELEQSRPPKLGPAILKLLLNCEDHRKDLYPPHPQESRERPTATWPQQDQD